MEDLRIPEILSRKKPLSPGELLDVWGLKAKLESIGIEVLFSPNKKRSPLLGDYSRRVEYAFLDIKYPNFSATLEFIVSERLNQLTQECELKSSVFTQRLNLSDWSSDSIINMLAELPEILELGEEENAKAEKEHQKQQKIKRLKGVKANALIGRAVGDIEKPYILTEQDNKYILKLELRNGRYFYSSITERRSELLDTTLNLLLIHLNYMDDAFDGLFFFNADYTDLPVEDIENIKLTRAEWLSLESRLSEIQAFVEEDLKCHQYKHTAGVNYDNFELNIQKGIVNISVNHQKLDKQLSAMNSLIDCLNGLATKLPNCRIIYL